jgi:ParB family chromosome partitioning protein
VAVSNLIRLLDLPDEALHLIESRDLTEGHGRALLTATDHAERRRLARAAVDGGWSVRELEERARRANADAGAPRPAKARRRRTLHPDQEAAAVQINDALGPVLGREVEVTPGSAGGYRVHMSFESLDDALELATRLGQATP